MECDVQFLLMSKEGKNWNQADGLYIRVSRRIAQLWQNPSLMNMMQTCSFMVHALLRLAASGNFHTFC